MQRDEGHPGNITDGSQDQQAQAIVTERIRLDECRIRTFDNNSVPPNIGSL